VFELGSRPKPNGLGGSHTIQENCGVSVRIRGGERVRTRRGQLFCDFVRTSCKM